MVAEYGWVMGISKIKLIGYFGVKKDMGFHIFLKKEAISSFS